MKVTAKNIEKLGFKLIVHGFMEDYTFNRPSITREDWLDVVVWQPRTNEIGMSTHSIDFYHIAKYGLPKGKKLEDYLFQVQPLKVVNSMDEVVKMLEKVKFI
jgi:hypothetical protein